MKPNDLTVRRDLFSVNIKTCMEVSSKGQLWNHVGYRRSDGKRYLHLQDQSTDREERDFSEISVTARKTAPCDEISCFLSPSHDDIRNNAVLGLQSREEFVCIPAFYVFRN